MKKYKTNLQDFVHYYESKPIEGNLEYITDPNLPLQFGIHEPKEARVSKMHFHKYFVEFFYVERGEIVIDFTDNNFNPIASKTIKQGDSFVMLPGIGHAVHFPAGCRVIEIHQGAYVDDKVFPNENTI